MYIYNVNTLPKTVIYIAGPTASGKSALAIKLGKLLNTAVVSADSRQFYRGMEIGTACVRESEQEGVPHFFTSFLNPDELYNAGMFERDALLFAEKWFETHDTLILTGGSGLYARAFLEGFSGIPDVNPEIRDGVQADLDKKGLRFLQDELKHKDPEIYNSIDLNNPRRVGRALEVIRQSGIPLSDFHKIKPPARNFRVISLALDLDREILYRRINKRVEQMMDAGLEKEVQALLDKGYHKDLPALRAVGYPEMIAYLNKELSLSDAVEQIQQHTRNYAKRQLTWLRREENLTWFSPEPVEQIIEWVQSEIQA